VSRTPYLVLGALAFSGLVLLMSSTSPQGWSFGPDEEPPDAQPVLILILLGYSEVETVREAIESPRVVARTRDGFALREGRIIATSHSAAANLLALAGWTDRSLELYVPSSARVRKSRGVSTSEPDGSRPEVDIAALAKKPTLTAYEALSVLKAMDGR
jgi:hypothetical protein